MSKDGHGRTSFDQGVTLRTDDVGLKVSCKEVLRLRLRVLPLSSEIPSPTDESYLLYCTRRELVLRLSFLGSISCRSLHSGRSFLRALARWLIWALVILVWSSTVKPSPKSPFWTPSNALAMDFTVLEKLCEYNWHSCCLDLHTVVSSVAAAARSLPNWLDQNHDDEHVRDDVYDVLALMIVQIDSSKLYVSTILATVSRSSRVSSKLFAEMWKAYTANRRISIPNVITISKNFRRGRV